MMIELRKIDIDNWKTCINLNMLKEDYEYIHENVYSIAEAQFYPDVHSNAIYAEDELVGYTMFGEDEDIETTYYIDRLMIALEHRKKGYASQTLDYVIHQASLEKYKRVSTSISMSNHKMKDLLRKHGFYTNNEPDGDEVIFHKDL